MLELVGGLLMIYAGIECICRGIWDQSFISRLRFNGWIR